MADSLFASNQTRKIAVAFTGGKDSCLALHLLASSSREDGVPAAVQEVLQSCTGGEVVLLVTFVPGGAAKSFKAHPLPLIRAQAQSLQLPLYEAVINAPYLESYQTQIKHLHDDYGVSLLVTGDILNVCDGFMSKAVAGTGVDLVCPLWEIERHNLLSLLWQLKMEAVITCVNASKVRSASSKPAQVEDETLEANVCEPSAKLDSEFDYSAALCLLGKAITPDFCRLVLEPIVAANGIDLCGELGEFHSAVTSAPMFTKRVQFCSSNVFEAEYAYLHLENIELV